MTRRALLIGSEVGSLAGVLSDVRAMRQLLEARGFAVTECAGPEARRDGILAAYERLIAETEEHDAVLVYYSGHGGRTVAEGQGPGGGPLYLSFIVPVDISESTEEDFRGITSLELSELLARLTERSRNVSVVFDSCHSARMARGPDFVPKALPRPWSTGIHAHMERLKARRLASSALNVESNPHAVRLVACGPADSAYEYSSPSGGRTGVLTESLRVALEEAGDAPVTWAALGARIRERVLQLVPVQRPEIEGPAERILFEEREGDGTGILPLAVEEGRTVLRGGRLHGVSAGDVYLAMPMAAQAADEARALGRATVRAVHGATSEVDVALAPGVRELPAGARGFPLELAARKLPVRIDVQGAAGDELRKALEGAALLRTAGDEEFDALLAVVTVEDGQLVLSERSGRRLLEPKPLTGTGILDTVRNLSALARAARVRALRGGEGEERLEVPYELTFGRVEGGAERPLAREGAMLFEGEPVYVKVTNRGDRKLYCSVFDVGLAGRIKLLTTSEPSGIELGPEDTYVLGWRESTGLRGLPVGWGKGVPRDLPRPESFVTFVMDRPQDLRALESEGMRGQGPSGESSLQRILGQLAWGGARDVPSEGEGETTDTRFAVEHVDFLVAPSSAPARERATFLLDERPDLSMRVLAPRPTVPAPERVEVRLTELIVHGNPELLGADVRIDTMGLTVVPGGQLGDVCRMRTARFPRVKEGERLPLGDLVLFAGPISGFLELAVWVSRDTQGSQELAGLVDSRRDSFELQGALRTLAGGGVPTSQVAAGVAAVGAVSTLVDSGSGLLATAAGTRIGLYRASLLPHESFGLGRHPAQGLLRAQGFSFAYEIIRQNSS
jgi:hypothetical protein